MPYLERFGVAVDDPIGFVYVGDYIQQGALRPPTAGLFDFTYTDEVFETVRRNAFDPERFAAMHVTLTPWSRIAAKYAP